MIRKTSRKKKLLSIRNGLKVFTKLKTKSKIKLTSKQKYEQHKKELELKKELLKRCHGLCEKCHSVPDFRGLSKHEVRFRSQGGDPLDPENTLMLCGKCHSQAHHIIER